MSALTRKRKTWANPAEFDEHLFVHESLIEICDRVGELLAGSTLTPTVDYTEAIAALNAELWKLRWELGMTGGHTVALADVESEAAE